MEAEPTTPMQVQAAEAAEDAEAKGRKRLPWRGMLRLAATFANTSMVLYVYAAHLMGVEWGQFGRLKISKGEVQSLREYLRLWDLDPAFEHLRLFTFSEAMLENLKVYVAVGTPVAVVIFALERDRIRWLQGLLLESLPQGQAGRAKRWLELYLWALGLTLLFILSIGPFHLELPRAHYLCTACALTCGSASMGLYLGAPVDLSAVAAAAGEDIGAWTLRQRWVRPVLKLVLGLHVVALMAGAWKAHNLQDDCAALLFGVLETALILGYQLFQGVFVVDDVMVSLKSERRGPRVWQQTVAEGSGGGIEQKLLAK